MYDQDERGIAEVPVQSELCTVRLYRAVVRGNLPLSYGHVRHHVSLTVITFVTTENMTGRTSSLPNCL